MKKTVLLIIASLFTLLLQAQFSKIVTINAGGLYAELTPSDLTTLTHLVVNGSIDARDFKVMRDSMLALEDIDLSAASIVAYTGTEGTSNTAPATYAVNQVPVLAFYFYATDTGKTSLKKVKLPTSAISIGTYAFYGCTKLQSIELPSALTTFGSSSFGWCSSLQSLNLPSTVTNLGNVTFQECTSLESINIPTGVTRIGIGTFFDCPKLKTTLHAGIISIRTDAFSGCDTIEVDNGNTLFTSVDGVLYNSGQITLMHVPSSAKGSFTIPSTVENIMIDAFLVCYSLDSVIIPASVSTIELDAFTAYRGVVCVDSANATYSSQDGILFNKDFSTLIYYPYVKKGAYIIPSTVTTISSSAFWACAQLSAITIPSSVTSLTAAFDGCTSLLSITASASTPLVLSSGYSHFTGVDTTLCTLYVPYGSKSLYEAAYGWTNFKHIIEGSGFWLSNQAINVSYNPIASDTVAIYSNTFWTVGTLPSWLTINQNMGIFNGKLIFTAQPNNTSVARTAQVTVSLNGLSPQIITFTQAADPALLVQSANTNSLSVYPNPAKNSIQIKGIEQQADLQIIDMNGKQVMATTINNDEELNISALEKGNYIISVRSFNTKAQIKLIKE